MFEGSPTTAAPPAALVGLKKPKAGNVRLIGAVAALVILSR